MFNRGLIFDISGEHPLYKNSKTYNSGDWRDLTKITEEYPVQRKLTAGECVFDLDHVSPMQIELIPLWLKESGLKFIAWKSGWEGLHIHFWCDVYGKLQKKALVNFMSTKIEKVFGVKNDSGPMGHGHIRAEFSFHPDKGYQKIFILSTVNVIDPINEISANIRALLPEVGIKLPLGKNSMRDGKSPKCMKYILSHQFSDGRERLLFIIASWYKANGLTDNENVEKMMEWARRNGKCISRQKVMSFVKSTTGKVGCSYRHSLLEDLGVDVGDCKYE